jgi:hypothetical protein
MVLDSTLQQLPVGLGAFQLDPTMDSGITKPIFDSATGLLRQAKLLSPKTAVKGQRSTIEIEYLWYPNSTSTRRYRINFSDIEKQGILSLGVERFDVVGDTRKSVQQTMGRINRSQLNIPTYEQRVVTLIWGNKTTQSFLFDGKLKTYDVMTAIVSNENDETDPSNAYPINIEASFTSFPSSPGKQPSRLLRKGSTIGQGETSGEDYLETYGDVGTINTPRGWWYVKPIGGVAKTASQLKLYLSSDMSEAEKETYKNNYTTYVYYSNTQKASDVGVIVDYEDTMYVDTWATAPDKLVIAGVCEVPQGFETTDVCMKLDANGTPLSLAKKAIDPFPTQFFQALEHMYYLNSHPMAIRRGDKMFINDFARGQRIPVTFKTRRYPMSVERPFLAPFELEFIALKPLSSTKEVSNSGL